MVFSDSIGQECPYTGRIVRAYIMFYKVGTTDHHTHVPGPVDQSSPESEYTTSCTTGMSLEYFRMLNDELLNKYPYVFPKQSPLIILDKKSSI